MNLKIDELNKIIESAKMKKNGTYSRFGAKYIVRDGHLKWYSYQRYVYEFCYGFTVVIGEFDEYYKAQDALKELGKKDKLTTKPE